MSARKPRRRDVLKAAGALCAPALLPACGGGGNSDSGDRAPPTLSAIDPPTNGTAVARASSIKVTFSENVAVLDGAASLSGPYGTHPVSVASFGRVVTLSPKRPLAFDANYRVGLSSGIRDAAGNSLAPVTSEFRTVARRRPVALGALMMDSYVRRRWTNPASNPWDALPDLFDKGFEWLRVAVTTLSFPELRNRSDWNALPWKDGYWSCLEVSGALLRAAADTGFRLHAMLFLSDRAADAGNGRQARPAAWTGLSDNQFLDAVRVHGAGVAAYYKGLGLDIEVFEIGNEIDFGVCGVRLFETLQPPPGVDALNDPDWMRENLWTRVSPILKAAIEGVRSVYPSASILLHVAGFGYSNNNVAASAFFESMAALGVTFDVAGLSFPYMFGGSSVPQPYFSEASFLSALDRIALLGRPIEIVEFSYPSKSQGTTSMPAPAYPFTPSGQEAFVRDFIAAVRGRVRTVHYFCPDYYDGFAPAQPELEGGGLFGSPGTGRPALEVLNASAEGRLLP